MITVNKPLFQLGKIVATPGALEALEAAEQNLWVLLNHHSQGDFGDVCGEDAALNHEAVNHEAVNDGGRILSAYVIPTTNEKLWIITEADRSSSCCLRPDEY